MMVSRINDEGHAFVHNHGNHNDDEDNIIIPPRHHDEAEGHYDDETENTTTRFTGIIECDVDPELGNLHKYHEPLNEMFRHDREQKTVFAVYGLQRIAPPIPQVSAQKTTSNTDELLETGANGRQSDDDDADEDDKDNDDESRLQKKKTLLLPNIITKGMYVDLDAFSEISSAPDRSRMLSDYLWKQMLVKVPQMSMWHRINGEYKLRTNIRTKDGGPGTFFRIRKYHLKRQGPKSSVLDLFMSLSKRYNSIDNINKKIGMENEIKEDIKHALENTKTTVTSYEVLISHDPDRVREILEIVSWNDQSSFLQMMVEPTINMSSSTSPTNQVQHSKASASTKDVKRNQSSVSAYIKKLEKMIRYYCDDMEESFWRRELDGFHIPIITEDTPDASNGCSAIV